MELHSLSLTLAEVAPIVLGLLGALWWLFYQFVLKSIRDDLKCIKEHMLTCAVGVKEELDDRVDYATFNNHRHVPDGPPIRGTV